jgi:hypothetical protein
MLSNVVINWLPSSTANSLRTLMPQAHAAVLLLIWTVLDALRYGSTISTHDKHELKEQGTE